MYSLSRGPSKIVASARRGHPRQLDIESYDNRDKSIKLSKINGEGLPDKQTIELSNPRPTFQIKKINKWKPQTQISCDPVLQENHIQMVSLLSRQWQKVQDCLSRNKEGDIISSSMSLCEVDNSTESSAYLISGNSCSPIMKFTFEIYSEKDCNKKLVDFKPFDLDAFWGGQTLKNVLGETSS